MNDNLKKQMAEQAEEIRTGIKDALKTDGVRFVDVMRDAVAYGVKPEDVAAIRREVEHDQLAANFIAEMTPDERVKGFLALLKERPTSDIQLQDADGAYRRWNDLSATGQLGVMASDAAYYAVPFEAFEVEVLKTLGAEVLFDAAMRVAFANQRELHTVSLALPDDSRTEPTPLADKVLNLVADLKHAEEFIRNKPETERER